MRKKYAAEHFAFDTLCDENLNKITKIDKSPLGFDVIRTSYNFLPSLLMGYIVSTTMGVIILWLGVL